MKKFQKLVTGYSTFYGVQLQKGKNDAEQKNVSENCFLTNRFVVEYPGIKVRIKIDLSSSRLYRRSILSEK